MSFSQDQKMGIIAQSVKTSCCKRALLQGILTARAQICDNDVLISVDSTDTANFVKGLIFDVYSKEATEVVSSAGGRRKLISFNAKSVSKYINELTETGISYPEKCQMCQSHFLRGIFLAAGRVSDPVKQYSLEFSVGDRAGLLADFFTSLGFDPKISEKKNETVVYFRNSTLLEDFFALANMNQTAFEVMNAKIEGELRNTANRIANCETNNIDSIIA